MIEVKIDKDKPIPCRRHGAYAVKYPFREMQIGDSFFIYETPERVCASTVSFSRRHPDYKFTTRRINGGVRVWRISKNGDKK